MAEHPLDAVALTVASTVRGWSGLEQTRRASWLFLVEERCKSPWPACKEVLEEIFAIRGRDMTRLPATWAARSCQRSKARLGLELGAIRVWMLGRIERRWALRRTEV